MAAPLVGAVANPHVRRVTLNLIRLSAACPTTLRAVLTPLATKLDWNFDRLSREDTEMIYALVDGALADAAKAEFSANTDSLIDHRHSDAVCKLCGHQHIRFEFLLENKAGGENVWTGSTCIEEYGLNVDGAATAEDALARLRAAIARAKRKVEREDWQVAYPDHEKWIDEIRAAVRARPPHLDWAHWKFVGEDYKGRWKRMQQWGRAIVKFYDREKFLTEKRTTQAFGANGVRALYAQLLAEAEKATKTVDERRQFWRAAVGKHRDAPADLRVYSTFQRAEYMVIATNLKDEEPTVGSHEQLRRYEEAVRAHNLLKQLEAGVAPAKTEPPDNSDLPF